MQRSIELLDATITVSIQTQNQEVLDTIFRAAQSQYRLQETVEGLSIIAISYYALGILGYIADGLHELLPIDKPVLLTFLAPVVILVVFLGIRRQRRTIQTDRKPAVDAGPKNGGRPLTQLRHLRPCIRFSCFKHYDLIALIVGSGMDITLKQLQIFQAVVVAGSITKASRRVGLSQPSISQQLGKLEEKLGAQLIQRNRTGIISLTPSGEYWFKLSEELLHRLDQAVNEHEKRFVDNAVTLRMGVPPTLRGPFTAAAARIASATPGFAKFELRFALTSAELVEQLRLHQLNCVIVNEDAIADDRSSFVVSELFVGPIVWAVPRSISNAEIEQALTPGNAPRALGGALGKYVDIDTNVPLHSKSEAWYRHHLPAATPTFSTMTYAAAIDLVAAGLATAHCPLSLLPGLPDSVSREVRFFPLDGLSRRIVLAMPKHLMSLPSYSSIFSKIVAYARDEYRQSNLLDRTEQLPGRVIEMPRRA